MSEVYGWLLDLFEDPQSGIILWFVCSDSKRMRLRQDFPVRFYARGSEEDLNKLDVFLHAQSVPVKSYYSKRRDLYEDGLLRVLAVEMQPGKVFSLVRQASKRFPALDFYDVDIPIAVRHTAQYGTFPLAFCQVICQGEYIRKIKVVDSPWDLAPSSAPLHALQIDLDSDPRHKEPEEMFIRFEGKEHRIQLRSDRIAVICLNSLLERYDPDLVLTTYGDIWLIPHLLKAAKRVGIPLKLNREPTRGVLLKKENSYMSYGRIIYRGQQALLYGRCHIDSRNSMLWQDYKLESVMEMARATCLPIQTAARTSPGTGINMMEVATALRLNILVPWQKTHGEEEKTAYDLLCNDQGGLAYHPIGGVHENVGMVDFISLYPSVMTYCNISPELPNPEGLGPSPYPPGLIPLTLKPLLEKRVALKQRMLSLPHDDPTRPPLEARNTALKMLLVCCFGYMGYKAAKFGKIESHEAISALSREALMCAKEAAEDMGFAVLHLYVDGMWIKKEGYENPEDFLPLLDEIARRTSLPVALDCIYRWVAFLTSRQDGKSTVPNRYFGIKQDGSVTVRGIAIRTHDTAPYIASVQKELLNFLKKAPNLNELYHQLPAALQLMLKRYQDLRQGKVRLPDLVVHKRMGKELDAYRVRSPAAIAAHQLQDIGLAIRLGQRIPLVYTVGRPGVCAWHTKIPLDPGSVNYRYYCELLIRAVAAIFQPFGVEERLLEAYLSGNGMVQLSFPFFENREFSVQAF